MKTIEERYSLCGHCLADITRYCHNNCDYYQKYVGATEQKAIDIDKACEWLKDNIHKDLTIGTYADTFESLIEDFCKAMEERG